MTNAEREPTHHRNLGPVVFTVGLLAAASSFVSCPVFPQESVIYAFPGCSRLPNSTVNGIYLGSVTVALAGSVGWLVLRRRARANRGPEPQYAVFRPFLWTTAVTVGTWVVLNIVLMLLS